MRDERRAGEMEEEEEEGGTGGETERDGVS